jgi:hypothetical protein
MSIPSSPLLPLAWADVLDKVAQTLQHAEAEAVRSEQALEVPPEPARDGHANLDRLDERMRGLQERLALAERIAAEADALLQKSQEAFARWLTQAEAVRRRLADVAAAGV